MSEICLIIHDGIGNHLDQINWITEENIDEEMARTKSVLLSYLKAMKEQEEE